jgi:hypothetical protein
VTQGDLEAVARAYEEAASELERAAGHCRVAADHYRSVDQPRGSAHALAARGHVIEALARLDESARVQASKASLPDD